MEWQTEIGITIYPTRMTDARYAALVLVYGKSKDKTSLWSDLKSSYDQFERSRVVPEVKFLPDGRHEVK